jgi:hypothetical protein
MNNAEDQQRALRRADRNRLSLLRRWPVIAGAILVVFVIGFAIKAALS